MASGDASGKKKDSKRWFALESNPQVMTKYVENLGMDTSIYKFADVLSTEDWALAMVPTPVLAVLFLYPIKDTTEAIRKAEDERIQREGQTVAPEVLFMKQYIGNACGTIGLLHAIGNNRETLTFEKGSFLSSFLERCQGKTPHEIAEMLDEDESIDSAHESAAQEGQSEQTGQDVNTHFIAFVTKGGHLYELDGRKSFPINHGASGPDTLLPDACKVIKEKFIDQDPGELSFTVIALCPAIEEEDEEQD